MLTNLKIKNVALIDSLDITFDKQLNVISGETGSGKSIMLNAMGFVFGDRLDKTLLREGTDSMRVDAFFDTLEDRVKQYIVDLTGIDIQNEMVITREYYENGKTVCKINDETVNTSILKKVSSKLIDIHGQHEHQSLMDNEYQLQILDMFSKGEINPYLEKLNRKIDELGEIQEKLNSLGGNLEQKQNLIDLYKYQMEEIEKSNIQPDEYENNLKKIKEMKSYEKIITNLQNCYTNLSNNAYGGCAEDLIGECSKQMNSLIDCGEKYANLADRLQSVSVELNDISKTIAEYISNCNFSAEDLQQLDERNDFIKSLFRKYGGDYDSLTKYYEQISVKLNNLVNSESLYIELMDNQQVLLKEIYGLQQDITKIRQKNAKIFAKDIQEELMKLGMPNANIEIAITKRAEDYTRKGQDFIDFMFSANIGFEPRPLAKIASGGELSRFMLAYKIVVGNLDKTETLIFDEIDTGLSGKMAYVVAESLARLSRIKQVITISHLPQLACMADTNFKVEKYSDSTTHTKLTQISNRDLYLEIARLMGLMENAQALQVAEDCKLKCNEFKKSIT